MTDVSPNQEQRAEEVFNAARNLPPGERRTFLERACGGDAELRRGVESLLEAHEAAGEFLRGTVELSTPNGPVEKPGDRVGRYKLLEQIGEGGFGVVWMAEQEEPVRRRVALKIIKLGMDTREVVARFEAERQALAMMEHPNIARVFDGGATDTGRPYFVMELVKGIAITQFCDASKLPTRERLDMFMQVCHAIQHAHQKGVIHRDLKPSNILVTVQDDKAVPKVIDFGVAKATQARLTEKTLFTRFRQWIGTPAYMSPEQAGLGNLDVDTRSDVYSLGVLLYELLTGQTPFDVAKLLEGGYDAVMRSIREDEPPKPSTRLSTLKEEELRAVAAKHGAAPAKLGGGLRGDLDWIVMRALEKDRTRRYETASALAADLQRHLSDQPITAVGPTLGYQLLKLVRRHRAALTTVCAFVLVLAVGAGVSVWQAVRANRQARFADARRLEADASRKQAVVEQARAQRSAMEASRLLTRQYERDGTRLLNERDLTGSLVYFTEALRREEIEPERAALHRLRLALVLGQCPELKGLLMHAGNVTTARFTAGGNEVVSAANITEGVTQLRVWDAAGLKLARERVVEGKCQRIILSPGGGWLATYDRLGLFSYGSTVRLWDVRHPAPGILLSTNGTVLSFSGDDRRVAVVSLNGVRVWDTARGGFIGKTLYLPHGALYAALSRDGTQLALCVLRPEPDSGEIGEVLLLNADTLEPIAPPLLHDGLPLFAGFDSTGQHLVTASVCNNRWGPGQPYMSHGDYSTGEARVWDVSSGLPMTPPLRHDQPVYQAEISPDGLTLVTVTGTAKSLVGPLPGERQMHFWDLSGKAPPASNQTLPLAGLITAKFATDGQRVLAGREYEILHDWWAFWGEPPADSDGFSLSLGSTVSATLKLKFAYPDFFVTFSPSGNRCLVSNKGRALQVWQLRASEPWTNKPLPRMDGRLLPRSELLADCMLDHTALFQSYLDERRTENEDAYLTVLDTEQATLKGCALPESVPSWVKGSCERILRFSLDGQRIGLCEQAPPNPKPGKNSCKLFVAVWGRDGGQPLFAREANQDDVTKLLDAVFDGTNRLLLALRTHEGVRVSDAATGLEWNRVFRLDPGREEAEVATFSADASRLLVDVRRSPDALPGNNNGGSTSAAGAERWLNIWRLGDDMRTEISFLKMTGKATELKPIHSWDESAPDLAAFSADGRQAVVKSGRTRFRIWDLERQSPVTADTALGGPLHSAEFSRDGKLLLTVSQVEQKETLQVWEVETGHPVSPPLPAPPFKANERNPAPRSRYAFEGRTPVAIVGYGGDELTCWALPLTPERRPVPELVLLAQWLSGRHLDSSGAWTELEPEAWQALGARRLSVSASASHRTEQDKDAAEAQPSDGSPPSLESEAWTVTEQKLANGATYTGRLGPIGYGSIGPVGTGRVTYANGEKYEGQWARGNREGKGVATLTNGWTFEGKWKADKLQGHVTLTTAGGVVTDCEFSDGKMLSGKGGQRWSDGTLYEGQWDWVENRGTGTITWNDGRRYRGEWRVLERKPGVPDGEGTMNWNDGRVYAGQFKDGKPHGAGKMTYPDRRVEQGLWRGGLFAGDAEKSGNGATSATSGKQNP